MAATVTFTQETLFAGAVRAIGSTLSVSDQDAQMLVDLGVATAPGLTPQIGSVAGALISGFAPLVSPALSGTPTSTTATAGTNTTQIATTAFVQTSLNAKVWVNFNGQGTVAIRASKNVSSITDNGVGDYTINFSAALADANYVVSCGRNAALGGQGWSSVNGGTATTPTASLVRVGNANTANNVAIDPGEMYVAIFR